MYWRYLSQVVRQECERVITELDDVKPQDAATTSIFLKSYYNNEEGEQLAPLRHW